MSSDTARSDRGTAFPERLAGWVGAATGAPRPAPDPVNLPAVRRWCQAMGFADETGHILRLEGEGSSLAPVTMLQAWAHHDRRFGEPEDAVSPVARFEQELEADGFTGVLGTTSVQRYHRQLRVGDDVVMSGRIKSISDLKQTRLGEGRFITFAYDYTDGAGDPVGLIEMTSLRYRPTEAPRGERAATDRPAPARAGPSAPTDDGSTRYSVPVSATLVVTGALATSDFHRVHHDAAFARANGNADIIMSIMTSLGLVERALWEWHGNRWQITDASMKLGSPCHPGDTLEFSCSLADGIDAGTRVATVRAMTERGQHLAAAVGLRPAADAR